MKDYALDIVIHDAEHLLWLDQFRPVLNDVWVKIDIGMGRLGYFADALPSVLEHLKKWALPSVVKYFNGALVEC